MVNKDKENSERFENALRDIECGLSIRKAGKKWGIPRSTLQDRLYGKRNGRGRRTVLTKAGETMFAEWLIERAKRGFGVTKNEFLNNVESFISKDKRSTTFKGNRPGNKWYRGFIKRNPQIKLRSARPLSKKRAQITPKDIDEWFTEYKKFIHEIGLEERPAQIWNCDESGFDLQGRAGKVMGPSRTKEQPYRVITGTKEHITVLPCYNATGQCIPPYILYPGKRPPVNYNLLEGGVSGSAFSMTEKGYMTAPTFYMWLANHFIPNIPPARPVVLLIDSAECHLDIETFELAKKNYVHIYALLKNATHLVQPADVGLFAAMKQSWYKNVRSYSLENPNTDINKKNFSFIFKNTWNEVMRPSLLIDSFRKAGIYPINREQLSDDQVRTSVVYSISESNNAVPTQLVPYSTMSRSDAAEVLASLSTLSTCPDKGSSTASRHQSLPSILELAQDSSSLRQNTTPGDLTKLALEGLEQTLPTPVKNKYKRRVQEGYNVPGSPTYEAWKTLYNATVSTTLPSPFLEERHKQPTADIQDSPSTLVKETYEQASVTQDSPQNVEMEASPVLAQILTYPSAENSGKGRSKPLKKTLPNFLNSETSMAMMREEKLKKARELAEKQKKLREREERKERRKQEQEEKKRKLEEKRRTKEKAKAAKRRKVVKRNKENKGKQWRQTLHLETLNNENTCQVCFVEYEDGDEENLPWVMCDSCLSWMHIDCVPIGIDTSPINEGKEFFCHNCA